jgi:hypothetical protein
MKTMWNKLKGFLGLLVTAGCVMIWSSFIPIDPFRAYSGTLGQYGWLLAGFGFIAFFIVLILHGINEYMYRFKPEPRHFVWRSKRVTRTVATISVIALIITGLGCWLGRPYLVALNALPSEQVASNPKQYENESVSVVGYYVSDTFGIFQTMGVNTDGFICPVNILESFTSLQGIEAYTDWSRNVLSGQTKLLFVELPPNTNASTGGRYVFNGVIEIENHLGSELTKLTASSIVSA